MDSWQSLVGTALVGTDRQTPELPQDDSALGTALHQLDWTQPEAAVLGAASAIALHQKVGRRAEKKDFAVVEPCDPDDLPCCSDRLLRLFDKVIDKHLAILPELLGLIAAAQQRIPAKRLPKLLKLGERKKELRLSIQSVLGKRGCWLATQNAKWAYAIQAADDFAKTQQSKASPVTKKHAGTQIDFEKEPWEWFNLALQKSQRWDIDASRDALQRFFAVADDRSNHIELSQLSIPLAMALHPGLAPEVARRVDEYEQKQRRPTLQHFLKQLSTTISLRWEIYQAILSSG